MSELKTIGFPIKRTMVATGTEEFVLREPLTVNPGDMLVLAIDHESQRYAYYLRREGEDAAKILDGYPREVEREAIG